MEAELEATYGGGTILRGSWAVQRAKDATAGQELTSSPHQLAKFTGSMPVLASPVFANLELQYNSSSVTLARARSPSFVHANFTLNTHDLWPGFEITGGVYNLFNASRAFPAAGEHAQDILEQQGRTYGARFIAKF